MRFESSIWRFCSALRTFNRGGRGATCFFRRGGCLFILGLVRSRRSRPVCCNRLAKLLRGTGLRAASSSRRISRSTSAALHFNSSRPARFPPTFRANAPCPNKSWHASSESSASRTRACGQYLGKLHQLLKEDHDRGRISTYYNPGGWTTCSDTGTRQYVHSDVFVPGDGTSPTAYGCILYIDLN